MINKEKADKIIKAFKIKFPEYTVLAIYTNGKDSIVDARKDPEKFKMGIPYFIYRADGTVGNGSPVIQRELFDEILDKDHMIYKNTEIDLPEGGMTQ